MPHARCRCSTPSLALPQGQLVQHVPRARAHLGRGRQSRRLFRVPSIYRVVKFWLRRKLAGWHFSYGSPPTWKSWRVRQKKQASLIKEEKSKAPKGPTDPKKKKKKKGTGGAAEEEDDDDE